MSLEQLQSMVQGKGAYIMTADKLQTYQHLRRPTGIPSMDLGLGGGLGGGATYVIYGPPKSCKTYVATRLLASMQRVYGKDFRGIYVPFSLPLDKPFARVHGMRLPFDPGEEKQFAEIYRSLNGVDPTPEAVAKAGEAVGSMLFAIPDATRFAVTEKVFEQVISAVKSRQFQIVVVDDMGGMPTADTDKKHLFERKQMAGWADLTTKFVQRVQKCLQMSEGVYNPCTLLVISQTRVDTNNGQFTFVGSSCLRHNIAGLIRMAGADKPVDGDGKEESEWAIEDPNSGDVTEGLPPGCKRVDWLVEKGKYGHGEGAHGTFTFSPTAGVDVYEDLVACGIINEEIRQAGAHYSYEALKAQGRSKFTTLLEKNPDVAQKMWESLLLKKGHAITYRLGTTPTRDLFFHGV